MKVLTNSDKFQILINVQPNCTFLRYNWLPYINLPFNPFSTNIPFLYLLKTSENWRFSDVFRGYRSESLVENGLRMRLAGKIPDYGDVTKYN